MAQTEPKFPDPEARAGVRPRGRFRRSTAAGARENGRSQGSWRNAVAMRSRCGKRAMVWPGSCCLNTPCGPCNRTLRRCASEVAPYSLERSGVASDRASPYFFWSRLFLGLLEPPGPRPPLTASPSPTPAPRLSLLRHSRRRLPPRPLRLWPRPCGNRLQLPATRPQPLLRRPAGSRRPIAASGQWNRRPTSRHNGCCPSRA